MRNLFAETWMQLHGAGLLALAVVMFVAPFIISVFANIGRPVPNTALRNAMRRRHMTSARRAVL